MSWRDLVITPAVQTGILLVAGGLTWVLHDVWALGGLASFAAFWILQTVLTIVALRCIRWIVPLRPGAYLFDRHIGTLHAWNMIGYLSVTNLSWLYLTSLIPPPLKPLFYRLLGARFGKGIIPLGGRMDDPWLMEMGEETMLGANALLLGHAVTPSSVVLGRIVVGKGAVIGAGSVVMPNVTIGERAMVNALSYVPMNTTIGPYEVWGGNPAQKIRDLPKPRSTGG